MGAESCLRAFGGGPLLGSRWLKQIHVDEAGTSRFEPKAVVAGVIIDGDRDFRRAEAAIQAAISENIPEDMQDGFVFHAKDIFGKHQKAQGWTIEKCNQITEAWLGILQSLKLPLVVAWGAKLGEKKNDKFGQTYNDLAHIAAFVLCLQKCDEFLALTCPDEVASILAEDCPQMKKKLKTFARGLAKGEFVGVLPHVNEPIRHIKNAVQFCDKEDAVLLQLADAAAFSFKRYICGQKGGDRLYHALAGRPAFEIREDPRQFPAGYRTFFWPD